MKQMRGSYGIRLNTYMPINQGVTTCTYWKVLKSSLAKKGTLWWSI